VWSAAHEGALPVVVDGGYVVIAARHGVSVRDAANGRERWHYLDPARTLARGDAKGQVVTGGGRLLVRYAAPDGQLIRVFDLATGKLVRSMSTPSAGDTAVVDASRVYLLPGGEPSATGAGSGPRPVRAVSLRDGHREWSFVPRCGNGNPSTLLRPWLTGTGRTPPTMVIAENCTVDSRHEMSTVTAVSTATGRATWHLDARAEPPDAAAVLTTSYQPADTPIVLVNPGGRITGINAVTGRPTTVRVSDAVEESAVRSVTTLPGGWCTAGYSGPVSCFDAQGHARWHRPLPRGGHTVGIATSGGALAVVTSAGVGRGGATTAWRNHFATTVELLSLKDGGRTGGAHPLTNATTTLPPTWPDQFDLHAYGPSGLFLSTLTDTHGTARLSVYR
jgi:hypothetical protein